MRCYVYTRVERVVYVVGTTGSCPADAFADVLFGAEALTFSGNSRDKPFQSMSAKNVMYVERVGTVAAHAQRVDLIKRAKRRAEMLNMEHADTDMVIEKRKRK